MADIKIFVEGKADARFLEDFINNNFGEGTINDEPFINIRGKDRIHLVKNQFIQNTDQGGTNLLIFDSDSDFNGRLDEINKLRDELGIEFELFLFPNHNDPGALEELLINLCVPEHRGIFECFDPFNICLSGKNADYHVPDLKTQIFSYLSFQRLESKEDKRNYLLDCWNLKQDYAKPLHEFLSAYFA